MYGEKYVLLNGFTGSIKNESLQLQPLSSLQDMFYLIVSIVFASLIVIVFKVFERLDINSFQAIVLNYFVSVAIGLVLLREPVEPDKLLSADWLGYAFLIGALFIFTINMIALTTRKLGLTTAVVSHKLSVVIPVLFAFILYGDSVNAAKISGIILALPGLILASVRGRDAIQTDTIALWVLPLLVFGGTGAADTLIKHAQHLFFQEQPFDLFLITLFGTAGIIGLVLMIAGMSAGRIRLKRSSFAGALLLGIPNYFAIHFFILALNRSGLESSVIFPLFNVSIVLLTTLVAVVIFKEKVSALNLMGLLLSIVSIILMSYGAQPV